MAAARGRHAVLSFTTRFRLPHEGMESLEYLSRGSAFIVNAATDSNANNDDTVDFDNLRVLTCQHVACPWRFPTYFADKWDWLQHVSEEFVCHSLQLLELPSSYNGPHERIKVLMELPLQKHVTLHPERDVAMLSLGDDPSEDFIGNSKTWNEYANEFHLKPLVLGTNAQQPGDTLIFSGHRQFEEAEDETEDGVGQAPKDVPGNYVGMSDQNQAFSSSREVLEEGMCGGAAVNLSGECAGLIEGIVPPVSSTDVDDPTVRMQKALENHVAFVPSTILQPFLKQGGPTIHTGAGLEDDDWL